MQFLYDCIVGGVNAGCTGAILADEMGLGKSLQSIALLYTLLRTGPAGSPVIRKAVVVCPSTLVQNWLREFKKWVGTERLKVRGVEASSGSESGEQEVQAFVTGSALHVLVLGYEMFKKHSRRLRDLKDALYVCDEGHRLKKLQGQPDHPGAVLHRLPPPPAADRHTRAERPVGAVRHVRVGQPVVPGRGQGLPPGVRDAHRAEQRERCEQLGEGAGQGAQQDAERAHGQLRAAARRATAASVPATQDGVRAVLPTAAAAARGVQRAAEDQGGAAHAAAAAGAGRQAGPARPHLPQHADAGVQPPRAAVQPRRWQNRRGGVGGHDGGAAGE